MNVRRCKARATSSLSHGLKTRPIDDGCSNGLSRFDGSLGGNIELIARWAIFDMQGNNIKSITSTRLREQVQNSTYADMVAAQSLALGSLSRELADAIIELSGK